MPNLRLLLEDIENTDLVSKLEGLRRSKGYTQRQLADMVGVTESTIANWERGRSGLEWFERVYRLCSILECKPRDLFDRIKRPGTEEMNDKPSYDELYALYKAVTSEIREGNVSPEQNSENREKLDAVITELRKYSQSDSPSSIEEDLAEPDTIEHQQLETQPLHNEK